MTPTNPGMTEPANLDQQLNGAILKGRALEAFDRFYADDVVMSENGSEPTRGKAANRAREEAFFGSIAELHELRVDGTATQGDLSFSEWVLDVTFTNGERKRLEQVAARRWRQGKVIEERFYYDPR